MQQRIIESQRACARVRGKMLYLVHADGTPAAMAQVTSATRAGTCSTTQWAPAGWGPAGDRHWPWRRCAAARAKGTCEALRVADASITLHSCIGGNANAPSISDRRVTRRETWIRRGSPKTQAHAEDTP